MFCDGVLWIWEFEGSRKLEGYRHLNTVQCSPHVRTRHSLIGCIVVHIPCLRCLGFRDIFRTRRIIFLFRLLWRPYVVRFAEQHQRVPRNFVEAEMLRRPIDRATSWIVEAFSYDVLIWSYLQLIGLWLEVYLQTFSVVTRGGVLSWWSVSCLVRNLDD